MTGTRQLELGPQRIEGLVFVRSPHLRELPIEAHDTGCADLIYVATDDVNRTAGIRDRIVAELASARRKVLFCSFLFADESIVAALCAAAERLHGGVYVLTTQVKHLAPRVLELDAIADADDRQLEQRAARHEDHLRRLADAGVWLRSAEDCHAKFCVIDDESAIVTSANATAEAYEMNPEHGLVVRSHVVARELARLFAHVWLQLATGESIPGTSLDLCSIRPRPAIPWRPLRGSEHVVPVGTLRRAESSLQTAAIALIDGAVSQLTIATYSFSGMEGHPIGRALQRAVDRGVKIDLLVQPRNHVDAQRAACAWLISLAPSRVTIYGHQRTHAKSIVADDRELLIWTGNLEASHGWQDGIEVGLHVRDPRVARTVAAWTKAVMARHTHRAVQSPSVADLVASGERCGLEGAWTVVLPPGEPIEQVAAMIAREPIEVLERRGGVRLRLGGKALLDGRLDASARTIHVMKLDRIKGPTGGRSQGWAANGTVTLVESPDPRPRPRSTASVRHRRSGKRGRR